MTRRLMMVALFLSIHILAVYQLYEINSSNKIDVLRINNFSCQCSMHLSIKRLARESHYIGTA